MKAAMVKGNPMNGETCSSIEIRQPAAPAIAKPSEKAISRMRSTSTPTSEAASGCSISARIASPVVDRRKNRIAAKQSASPMTSTTRRSAVTWKLPMRTMSSR